MLTRQKNKASTCNAWQKNPAGPPDFTSLTGSMQESVLLPVALWTWHYEVHPLKTITASHVNVALGSERSFLYFKLSNCSKCRSCNSLSSEEEMDASSSSTCRATALGPAPVASKDSSWSVLWRHHRNRSTGMMHCKRCWTHSPRENSLRHHLHFKAGLFLYLCGSGCPSTSLRNNFSTAEVFGRCTCQDAPPSFKQGTQNNGWSPRWPLDRACCWKLLLKILKLSSCRF